MKTDKEKMMLVDPLGPQRKIDPALAQQVKAWVSQALHIGDGTTLMVTEMRCTTSDCPPIKTVIALMETAQPIRQYKIHKPLAHITPEDIAHLTTIAPKLVDSTVEPQEKETHV
jgi:hypothetical protein